MTKGDGITDLKRKSEEFHLIPGPAARQPGSPLSRPGIVTFAHFYATFALKVRNIWATRARSLDAQPPDLPESSFTPLFRPVFLVCSMDVFYAAFAAFGPPSPPDAALSPGLPANSETGVLPGPAFTRESSKSDGICPLLARFLV